MFGMIILFDNGLTEFCMSIKLGNETRHFSKVTEFRSISGHILIIT